MFILFIFLLGSFYFSCLPHFIQGGDTAELVASAHQLLVAHPPGYPLWTWLQHFWLHFFHYDTLFWRASVLNLFFSLATLFILGLPLRKKPVFLLICIAPLSLTTTFSEMAILPKSFPYLLYLSSASEASTSSSQKTLPLPKFNGDNLEFPSFLP